MNLLLIALFTSCLIAQIPDGYLLSSGSKLSRFDELSIKDRIASNVVVDIQQLDDSLYLFGTGAGLSFGELKSNGSIDFGYFSLPEMPRGGNPSLSVFENIIAVSGVVDTNVVTGYEPKGTGIAYSKNGGNNWEYLPQPIDPDTVYFINYDSTLCSNNNFTWDNQNETCFSNQNWTISWGSQEIKSLLVSSEVDNVSYDLAISTDYIYAASWAGGLRRYPINLLPGNSNRKWEIIPLPRDNDFDLYCGEIDTSFYLNPRDPIDGGYHNHKGFSVYVNEDIIWVGTAAGINKGVINGNCIDWVNHYNSWTNNISGNWVVGIHHQDLDNYSRYWAITWSAETPGEFSALSYTDDDGNTWKTTQPSGYSEKVYNIYTDSNRIWASSESGLYLSEDGEHWEKYIRPIDKNTDEELSSDLVMSTYYSGSLNWIWMGTDDGIAISEDEGISWEVYRFWESTSFANKKNMLKAYPNPFLINDYNIVGNDGHVRFIYSNPYEHSGNIDVFDFAMDKVIHLNNPYPTSLNGENEIIWNGRNEYGDKIANGVYFCRLSLNGKYFWTKLAVIN